MPGGKTPSSTVLLLLNKTTISFDRAPKNEDVAKDFVTKFKLELICRSHEVVEDGVAYFADRTVVTHGIRLAPGGQSRQRDRNRFIRLKQKESICKHRTGGKRPK